MQRALKTLALALVLALAASLGAATGAQTSIRSDLVDAPQLLRDLQILSADDM